MRWVSKGNYGVMSGANVNVRHYIFSSLFI